MVKRRNANKKASGGATGRAKPLSGNIYML